jgi:hypothetical protein
MAIGTVLGGTPRHPWHSTHVAVQYRGVDARVHPRAPRPALQQDQQLQAR